MEFSLPRHALPDSKVHRRILLDEYFPQGLIPFESLTEQEWKVVCFSPKDPAYFIDPAITRNLENWIEPINLESMEGYWRIYKNSYISFIDSWTLHYWSLFLDWLRSRNEELKTISIIHVDDHLDQASPHLIIKEDDSFECLFTKKTIDVANPSSIHDAILSKSIDIGSFFTPFMHAVQSVNIFHLKYTHKGNPKKHGLICTSLEDRLLAHGKQRPALSQGKLESPQQYTISASAEPLIEKLAESPYIFLHIDCDAFNNRYNGNSLWHKQMPSIDLNLAKMKEKVDDLFNRLSSYASQIYLNIALSPGFFPSEFWRTMLDYIITKATDYGFIRDDEFSNYLKNKHPKEVIHEIFD